MVTMDKLDRLRNRLHSMQISRIIHWRYRAAIIRFCVNIYIDYDEGMYEDE